MTAWQSALAWAERINHSKRVSDWLWEIGGGLWGLLIALMGLVLVRVAVVPFESAVTTWHKLDRIEQAQAQMLADMKARLDQIHEELRERK